MGLSNEKNNRKMDEPKGLNLKELKARVDRISIDGLGRTKDDIIVEVVEDLFSVNNFEEMLKTSNSIKNKLDGLGCFQNVLVHVDVSSGSNATPGCGYEVTYIVREMKQLAGGVSTMIGTNNEGLLVTSLNCPNILGRGEKLQGEFCYGSKQTRDFNLTYSKPLLGLTKYNTRFVGSIFAHNQDFPMSMYKLGENGAFMDLSFFILNNLKHNIQWEGTIRDINVGSRYAAFDIREHAGSTLKSSLRHILTYDSRRFTAFPTSGILSKLSTEFAGLGGNVGFLKNDALFQLNIPVIKDIVFQASVSGGCLLPVDPANKSIVVCDHFFLGGPTTFRGFDMRGAGPSLNGNFLGAKTYWCASLSLFTPLPFRPSVGGFGENFRTHFFVNIGNVGDFNLKDGVPPLLHQARLAYGIGLALRFANFARLEVNYCFPRWFQEGDKVVHGIQIGISSAT